ncbi:MAG: phosphatase PAP2 family protein [Burkholderiaceae bacterium]|jgi:undecaprenyl-diphosphatase|nr:phosphatase PAP2 family protein [Burkholderiaceae bacterium]
MQVWLERTRARWVDRDRRWVTACHRIAQWPLVVLTLVLASRLADGPLWYALIALLPLTAGRTGTACALQMLGVGLLNLAIYRYIKQRTCRPRPFVACPGIRACTAALDDFSFPSGHTLHAVAFSIVLAYHYPWAAWIVGPFALLVAASRMVLGLHYPSDVAVGAAIGVASAVLVLMVN